MQVIHPSPHLRKMTIPVDAIEINAGCRQRRVDGEIHRQINKEDDDENEEDWKKERRCKF